MKVKKIERMKVRMKESASALSHFSSFSLSFSKGFTLIEMLISLAIFGVITGMVMANFKLGAQGDELRISSQLVASSIRRAQTMAIAGQTVAYCQGGTNNLRFCPNGAAQCPGGSCVREIPPGYGVHFSTATGENKKTIIFADLDGNNIYSTTEEIDRDSVSSGPFVRVSAVAPAASNALDIIFVPPKPTIVLNNNATADGVAVVTVRHDTIAKEKRITINKISGQISAE